MPADVPRVEILGVPIAAMTTSEALQRIAELVDAPAGAFVAFANAHTLNVAARDETFRAILRRADLVLNDGIGVAIAARLQGRRFPTNLNGTDFTPAVLDLARAHGWRVYLLGSRGGVAHQAGARLVAQLPGLDVVGTHEGWFDDAASPRVVEDIRQRRVDLLLVGMGNPRQEQWIDEHLRVSGARLALAVGAFIDFAAGTVPRAPDWMKRARVEWLYRLWLEPGRMWRRYVLGNPVFLARAVGARFGHR